MKEYKQVILINIDLGMRAGKIIAQALHSEVMYMEDIKYIYGNVMATEIQDEMYQRYREWTPFMKKVVLKCNESELHKITGILDENGIKYYPVHDAGLTQVEPGSLTCIAIEPWEESKIDEITGNLKLL